MEPIVNPADEADAGLFLDAATAAVRAACGWHVAPSLQVEGSLRCNGSRILRLPLRAVSSLDELTDRAGNDLLPHCDWDADGLVELRVPVAPGIAAVRYRATAGHAVEEVPILCAVILQAARRAASAPGGYVRSESVNGASVSYALGASGAPAVSLLPEELALIAPYRVARLP